MKNLNKHLKLQYIMFFAAIAACAVLIKYPEYAKHGINEAISTCFSVIVPSLFPMLIISCFASACEIPEIIKKACHKPLNFLFGISGSCFPVLLLGLCGGYPLSAKTALLMQKKGRISKEEAKRIALFMTSPGLSFSVSIAGTLYYKSAAAGFSLLFSCIFADFLCAFIYNRLKRQHAQYSKRSAVSNIAFSENLISAVTNASSSILSVCAWITAFSAFCSLLTPFAANTSAEYILSLICEVTSALKISAAQCDIPLTAFTLAFGGLCIFFQLLPDIKELGISSLSFLLIRGICAAGAYLTELLLTKLFSFPVSANAGFYTVKFTENSFAGSAALLFMCFIFLLQTSQARNMTKLYK